VRLITSLEQVSKEEQLSWLGHTYAFDVETEGLAYKTDKLIGIALYVNNMSYYFVLQHSTGKGQEVKEYLTIREVHLLLDPVMSQSEEIVLMHNGKFDLHYVSRYGFPLRSKLFDTLIAAQLLDENRKNGLKSLAHLVDEQHAKYETMAEYHQFDKKSAYAVPLDKFAEYAAADVVVTFKLYEKFRKQLAMDGFRGITMQDVFTDLWMPLVPVLQEIEERGFRVNLDKIQELRKEYFEQTQRYQYDIEVAGFNMLINKYHVDEIPDLYWKIVPEHDIIETDSEGRYIMQCGVRTPVKQPTERSKPRKLVFNVGSPAQVNDLIFYNLELPEEFEMKYTPSGSPSADADNLQAIRYFLGEETPEHINTLLEWRLTSKFLTTYLEPMLEKNVNGRMHAFFNMAAPDAGKGGTTTGRLSSNAPNLQNIPSRGEIGEIARHLFIPSEGMKLIVADYSSMESVVFAHYSGDAALTSIFEKGLDMHSVTASGVYNIPYDDFVEKYKSGDPEFDKMRRLAKTLFFASGYGVGPKKLQRLMLTQNKVNLPLEEVRQMLDNFYTTYSGLTAWKQQVMEYATKNGFVVSLMGRKRRLPGAASRDRMEKSYAQRQAVSFVVQGSCADIMYRSMEIAQPVFKSLGGGLLASVHDEIIGEVPEKYATTAARMLEVAMTEHINPILKVPLSVEAGIGDTWATAKGG